MYGFGAPGTPSVRRSLPSSVPCRAGVALGLHGGHVGAAVGAVRVHLAASVPGGSTPGGDRRPLHGGQQPLAADAIHPVGVAQPHTPAQVTTVADAAAVADDDTAEV